MSTFNEADHPRAANGTFTDKPQSAPEIQLGLSDTADAAARLAAEVDGLLPEGHRFKGDLARLTAIAQSVFAEGGSKMAMSDRGAAAVITRTITVADRHNIHVSIPGDAAWPTQLDDIHPPVPALWSIGDTSLLSDVDDLVFVGGSRASTSKGDHDAAAAVNALVGAGKTVISTGQYGIGGVAARAAIAAGSRPILVSCAGLDRAYPAGLDRMFEQVKRAGGLLLTAEPPAFGPTRYRMMRQLKVATELSGTAIIVEGSARSGSVMTLAQRDKNARPLRVLAIEQPETAVGSLGPQSLVDAGQAQLVSDPTTITSHLE